MHRLSICVSGWEPYACVEGGHCLLLSMLVPRQIKGTSETSPEIWAPFVEDSTAMECPVGLGFFSHYVQILPFGVLSLTTQNLSCWRTWLPAMRCLVSWTSRWAHVSMVMMLRRRKQPTRSENVSRAHLQSLVCVCVACRWGEYSY